MTKVAIVYHTTYGHTKLQAEAVLRGAKSVPNVSAQLYTTDEAAAAQYRWADLVNREGGYAVFVNNPDKL